MDKFVDFSSLLNNHLSGVQIGEARLETLVNKRFGHIIRISRSTIRNWRDGSSKSVADWRQIVAAAAVLNLSAVETEQLLQAARLERLTTLWTNAQDNERELLGHWFEPLLVQLIDAELIEIKAGIDQLIEDDKQVWSHLSLQASLSSVESLPSSPPFILPQLEIPFFTGRQGELEQLEKLLLKPGSQRIAGIVGVTGTGGMGKSALAYHFADINRDHFPDGVIGLRVDGGQADTIAARFAHHAGVEIKCESGLTASEIMQSVFSRKRALLIFDNAEDAAVRALQPGGEQCAVIVTSRNRSLFDSFGIPKTALIDLPRFESEETNQMLIKMLGAQRVLAEMEAVQEIHTLVGGLPLALRITGGFLADQSFTSLEAYAAMLRDERTRLSYLRDPDDPSLDVRASFEISLRYLDEPQINLFACLGVCAPEGFSVETVQVVSKQDAETVRNDLGRLLRLSLVSKGGSITRFVLHPLLFIFALELAEERALLKSAEHRHTEYFRQYANKHRGLSPINLSALGNEFDALLLTARRLTNGQIADYGFYLSLEPFLQAKGYWTQALHLIDLFLRVAKDSGDFYVITQFLLQQGQFFQLQGEFDAAEQALQEAEKTAFAIDNNWEQQRALAMVLNSLGGVYQRQGKFEDAIGAFQRSYLLLVDIQDEHGQAMVLNSLGSVHQRQGRFDEAVHAFEQSHTLLVAVGDERGKAMVLNSLGGVYHRRGQFDKAISAFQCSAQIEERLGNKRGEAMILNSLGGAYQRQGKFNEAVHTLQRSVKIEEEIGNTRGQAMVLNSLGSVYQRQGKFNEAATAFQQSHCLLLTLGDKRGQAMVLNSLGIVYQRQGRFDDAAQALIGSAAIEEDIGNARGQAMVLNSLGGVYQRQGKFDEAASTLQQSILIEERIGNVRGQAMVLNSLGGVYRRQGKLAEAVDALRQSCKIAEQQNDKQSLAMRLNSLGNVYQQQGRLDEAYDAFQRSYDILQALNDQQSLAMVLFSFGKALLSQKDFVQAVEKLTASFEINEALRIAQGMRIVTPSLVRALTSLGRTKEAQYYCSRGLIIAHLDHRLLRLQEQLSKHYPVSSQTTIKRGYVKRLIRNPVGYLYGFIAPYDGAGDVYFGENEVHGDSLSVLAEGLEVNAEVEQSARGPRARRVWQDGRRMT